MIDKLYGIFREHPAVATDSRAVVPGAMFFALRGERFDGNRFAAAALEGGAACAVVDDPSAAVSDRCIVVENVLETLQALAACHRRMLGIPVLAITGTNGKTTTKELIARVLSKRYEVAATRGNLNNHIGVPLTLLAMRRGVEIGIVEMGAGACGEIELLCRIARPDFGLITNVGRAHLEGFGSEEGVRRGKGELYDYLAATGGTALLPSDDSQLVSMADEREGMRRVEYPYSLGDGYRSALEGEYNRHNIAAAVAAGRCFEVGAEEIREAVEGYVPDNHRSQVVETGRNVLVADCYNANPSSMAAAISNFVAGGEGAKGVMILGDMLELGKHAAGEHLRVIETIAGSGFAGEVFLVGDAFAGAVAETGADGAPSFRSFADSESLAQYLAQNPLSGRRILLKGSRGIGLERVIELL